MKKSTTMFGPSPLIFYVLVILIIEDLVVTINFHLSFCFSFYYPFYLKFLKWPPVFGVVGAVHLFSFLCCVFGFCLSSSCILCTQYCQCLLIVHSWLLLRISLTFLYLDWERKTDNCVNILCFVESRKYAYSLLIKNMCCWLQKWK